jgi:hypothetical protein
MVYFIHGRFRQSASKPAEGIFTIILNMLSLNSNGFFDIGTLGKVEKHD